MGDELRNLTFRNPFKLAGGLAPGALIAEDAVVSEVRRIAGAASFRVRAKFSQAGVLRVSLLRHDQSTEITDPAAQSVAIVADTLATIEFTGLIGETYVLIEFTAGSGIPADAEVDSVEVYTSPNSDAGGVALLAGEAHLGTIGAVPKVVSATFTRPSDTDPYAPGDVVCNSTSAPVIMTFAGCSRLAAGGGSGLIMDATLLSSANQSTKGSFELWLFDTPVAMDNDNAVFTPTDAEAATLVAILPFTTAYVGDATAGAGGNSVYFSDKKNVPFVCTSAEDDLFGILVARNAYTPVSAGAFTVRLFLQQD